MGRLGHLSVIESIKLKQLGIRVADLLHHAPQVGVLLVTPEHLQVAISSDQQQRRRIFADMIQRRQFINDRLRAGNPALGPAYLVEPTGLRAIVALEVASG